MESTKVHWTLDNDAIALVDQWTSPGKRGELVSEIIRAYAKISSVVPQSSFELDCGVSERIEQRLTLIEQRIALLQLALAGEQIPVTYVGNGEMAHVAKSGAGNES